MAAFRFLHLSDLHFKIYNPEASDDKNRELEEKGKTAREALASFITNEKMRQTPASDGSVFDYVFITGDVAFKTQYPSKEELKSDSLINALKCAVPQDGKERIFWAVGNHDMARDLDHALDLYQNHYWDVTSTNIDNIPDSLHWIKVKKGAFNLLVLNTNSKTHTNDKIDVIESTTGFGHITFCASSIRELLAVRDSSLPTIVIGHHGMSWFSPEIKLEIAMLFDNHNVDFYLCGHEHRLGYARFDDGKKDIHQITCGGCMHDGYAVFSVILGEYRNGLYHLVPYKFHIDGSGTWGASYDLHRKLSKDNVFMRSDYEEMIRKCIYQLWEKHIDIDQSQIADIWQRIWFSCLELLKNQSTELKKEEFISKVVEIVFNNIYTEQHTNNAKEQKTDI